MLRFCGMNKVFKKAFLDTVPVLSGYLVLGFGFGILIKASGYGMLVALVMSVAIYAGSMQYALVGLMTGGASLITVALTTLMVNARHLFYGVSMLDKYSGTGGAKPYLIFSLTDETYSLVCDLDTRVEERYRRRYALFVSILNHSYWILGTLLGALLGTVLKFNSEGIEFALTALFLTVFVDQWINAKKYVPAIIGVLASVLALLVFGKESFLIPAMLIIALSLCLYREKGEEADRK